jgi:two-component system, OmpR family, sensor histidine kinase TctE
VNSSISRQLVLWLTVPLTLLALAGGLMHYFNNLAPQVIRIDHQLKDASAALVQQLAGDAGDAAPLALTPGDRGIRFAIRDSSRTLIAGDARLPAAPRTDGANPVYTTTQIEQRKVRLLSQRIETSAGPRILTVASELSGSEPAARYSFMSTLLWDFVQLDLTLVLVWAGIQVGLRPLTRLRNEIAERSSLDLRPIAESSVPREVAPLAATLNRLFALLRTTSQSQQQFIADTAHQLRTPLTGMLAQLDLLMAEPASKQFETRFAMLQAGLKQLSHATNQLLALARADAAVSGTIGKQDVDLRKLAAESVARFFDRALPADIDLGADLHPATVSADPALLDDLLSNLIDNALQYTPRGGRVTVACGVRQGRVYLSVEDNGPGIPEADRQRVRQRYVRLPNSPGPGSGLGLAIVEDIARLYDASLSIETGSDGTGTRVSIQFP